MSRPIQVIMNQMHIDKQVFTQANEAMILIRTITKTIQQIPH